MAALWLRAGIAAAAWLTAVDLVRGGAGGVGVGGAAWLLLGSLAVAVAVALPATLLWAPLWATRRGAGLLRALRAQPVARVAAGALLVALAAAAVAVNARIYVRLYLSLHMALSLCALCAAQAGFALLLPAPATPADGAGTPRRRLALALAAAGITAWALALAGALVAVTGRPLLRVAALDRTTLLSQGLLAMHQAWGILDEARGAADAEAVALLEPRPLPAPAGPARGASVLLVTVDSLRADAWPAGGAMEAIARDGVRFTRAYAPSCWTIHSMAAVLTSRLPSQLRYTYVSVDTSLAMEPHAPTDELVTNPANARKVTPVPWDDPTPSLAAAFTAAGYQTATMAAYVFYRPEAGVTRDFATVDDSVWREHNLMNDGVTSAPLTDAALAWLARRDRERPFFLWIHYMDPHAPYRAQDAAAEGGGARARYDSEVRLVDRELGRLLDAMRESGVLDDTIVVIHADHGEEFGDHGGGFHATTVYEEIVHVPLVVRAPARARLPAGAAHAEPVSLLDLGPTLLDLTGVAAAAPAVGRSLLPALRGEALPARPVFAECKRFGRDRRMALDWPWKLIVDRAVGTVELYRLDEDPGERENRVERGDAAEPLARLRRLVDAMP